MCAVRFGPVVFSGGITDRVLFHILGDVRFYGVIGLFRVGARPISKLDHSNLHWPAAEFPAGPRAGYIDVQLAAFNFQSRIRDNVLSRISARVFDLDPAAYGQYRWIRRYPVTVRVFSGSRRSRDRICRRHVNSISGFRGSDRYRESQADD